MNLYLDWQVFNPPLMVLVISKLIFNIVLQGYVTYNDGNIDLKLLLSKTLDHVFKFQ